VLATRPEEPATLRVGRLFEGVLAAIEEVGPEALALEAQYFYRQNERAFQVGWGVGAVLAAAHRAGLSVYAYMVRALLGLAAPLTPSHAADAAAVALTHLAQPPEVRGSFRL